MQQLRGNESGRERCTRLGLSLSGVSNPALLHCEKLDAFMVVHGTLGDSEALSEVERVMSSHYTMKVRAVLGADRDDAKEARILNRYVLWKSDGEIELD